MLCGCCSCRFLLVLGALCGDGAPPVLLASESGVGIWPCVFIGVLALLPGLALFCGWPLELGLCYVLSEVGNHHGTDVMDKAKNRQKRRH